MSSLSSSTSTALSPFQLAFARSTDLRISILRLGPQQEPIADGGNPNFRSKDIRGLLKYIAPLLPEATKIVISTHDMGSTMMGDDQRQFLEGMIAAGEYVDPDSEEMKRLEWNMRYKKKGLGGLAVSLLLRFKPSPWMASADTRRALAQGQPSLD